MGRAYHFYCVIRGSCAADFLLQQKLLLFFYLPLVTNCRNQLKKSNIELTLVLLCLHFIVAKHANSILSIPSRLGKPVIKIRPAFKQGQH